MAENDSDINEKVYEKVEGIDDEIGTGWGDYPIDTVLIRTETRTAYDVVRRIKEDRFIMKPDFQRDFIWSNDLQSRLIESVLMRLPLPVFYLAENEEGKLIVVDGLQRLSTFKRFFENQLQLKLKKNLNLNLRRFEDLSPKLQNRVEDCNLVLYIIDAKVPEQVRLDIFERVNSGLPLTRQQMRNCLYMGIATTFLREEAESEVFLRVTGESLDPKKMRDREFINRFISFKMLGVASYGNDMDDFLAKGLKRLNASNQAEIEKLRNSFHRTLENNYYLFGKHSFRKHQPNKGDKRSILNASLWDVMSTGLSEYSIEQIEENIDSLKEKFYALLADKEFNNSITFGPNANAAVNSRFSKVNAMLKEVFNAEPTKS